MGGHPNYETMNHQARRNRLDGGRGQQLRRIFERDKGICALCGLTVDLEKDEASRDHIKDFALCETVEEARSDANMQLAHKCCNNLKSQQLLGGVRLTPTLAQYHAELARTRRAREGLEPQGKVVKQFKDRLQYNFDSIPGIEKLRDMFREADE